MRCFVFALLPGCLIGWSPFDVLDAGTTHVCRATDRQNRCWGSDANGETRLPRTDYVDLSAGDRFTCGILGDGPVNCWGDLAGNFPLGEFTSVSAGGRHACAIADDGSVECWGEDLAGETALQPGTPFRSISAGVAFTCGITFDDTLSCWGDGTSGQTDVPTGSYSVVSAGNGRACAIASDSGPVVCWGQAFEGPQPSGVDRGMAAISVGDQHACGLRDDGSLVCWGADIGTQGNGNFEEGRYSSVTSGTGFSCAVSRETTGVNCWGVNDFGVLNTPEGGW